MGSSLPASGRFREDQTQELIRNIMRLMLTKTNIVDLYSLSDPAKCKEYVVATKDALQKLFSEIKVYPEKGGDGVFYFQRIKGLRLRSDDVAQQDARCKDLAFFYVRIFQIFAALALTIFDSAPRDVYLKGKVGEARGPARLAYGAEAPGFGPQRGGLRVGDDSGVYPIDRSDELIGAYVYVPYYIKKVETFILQNLMAEKEGTSYRVTRLPLRFKQYSKMGDGLDEGILSIDQSSIYIFGETIKENILQPKRVTIVTEEDRDVGTAAAAAPAAAAPAPTATATARAPAAAAPAAAAPAPTAAATAPAAPAPAAPAPAAPAPAAPAAAATATARAPAPPSPAATAQSRETASAASATSGAASLSTPLTRTASVTSDVGEGTPTPSPARPIGSRTATLHVRQDGGTNKYKLFDYGDPPRNYDTFKKRIITELSNAQRLKESDRRELMAQISYARYRSNPNSFKPRIRYSFMIGGVEKWIEAEFDFDTSDSNPSYIEFNTQKFRSDNSGESYNPRKGVARKNAFQNDIVTFLVDIYRSKHSELSFSIIKFLQNIRAISSNTVDRNETAEIFDTKIYIDSTNEVRYWNKVPIYFKGRIPVLKEEGRRGDDTRNVKIYANLYMEMERTSGQFEYRVKVSFAGHESENPPYFRYPERAIIKTFVANNSSQEPYIKSDSYKTFRKELQKIFANIIEKRDTEYGDYDDTKYTRDGMPIPYDSDRMDKEYRVKTFWDALRQDPPVKAHCVARALQLLNAEAIYGSSTERATSHVCDIKFSLIQNHSLPDPAKDVTSSAGISVLVNLFFDKLLGETQAIRDQPDYQSKVAMIRRHFVRVDSEEEERAAASTELSAVKEYLPPFCESGRGGTVGEFELRGRRDIDQLRSRARALLSRQVKHIGRAVTIIFKLFDEGALKKNDFAFHPRIRAGGIRVVNEVAREARNLLIDYYSDCEDIYKDGLLYLNRVVSEAKQGAPGTLAKRFSMSDQGVRPAAAVAPPAPRQVDDRQRHRVGFRGDDDDDDDNDDNRRRGALSWF